MDAVERLSYDATLGTSLSASEHVQRYRWAARAVRGMAVLDLCCGVGYGTQLLRQEAASALGVDRNEDAVAEARRAARDSGSDVTFEQGDAHRWLEEDLHGRFGAIVCFEGLEHLPDLEHALERLSVHAGRGTRLLVSVPNSRTFGERNEFHLTDLEYDSAMAKFGRFEDRRIYFQYVAEGAVILAEDEQAAGPAELFLPDRTEPEYANTFLCAVNVPREDLEAAAAHMRFTLEPYQSRALENLKKANDELWHTNRELGRQLTDITAALEGGAQPLAALRSADTAAGSAIHRLLKEQADEYEARLEATEALAEEMRAHADRATRSYLELRNRKIVRLALRAMELFGR